MLPFDTLMLAACPADVNLSVWELNLLFLYGGSEACLSTSNPAAWLSFSRPESAIDTDHCWIAGCQNRRVCSSLQAVELHAYVLKSQNFLEVLLRFSGSPAVMHACFDSSFYIDTADIVEPLILAMGRSSQIYSSQSRCNLRASVDPRFWSYQCHSSQILHALSMQNSL